MLRAALVIATIATAGAFPSKLSCSVTPAVGSPLMSTTVVQDTTMAKLKRGDTVLDCGGTVKACESLSLMWTVPTDNQFLAIVTNSMPSDKGSVTCEKERSDTLSGTWMMPSDGTVDVMVTYAMSRSTGKQTAKCSYTVDTADSTACSATPAPSSAATTLPATVAALVATVVAAVWTRRQY